MRDLIEQIPPIRVGKSDKTSKDEQDRLKRLKASIKELERNNYDSIIIFDSGAPWYKMAFNSNLIYEFYVLPYIDKPYFKPHEDRDYYAFSRTGVTSVSDIVSIADALKKRGATVPESLEKYLDGSLPAGSRPSVEEREKMYVFKFEGITMADVEVYLEKKFADEQDANALVLPNYIPQELYTDMRRMATVAVDIVRRLPKEIRSTVGTKLINLTLDALTMLNISCNGYGGGGENDYKEAMNAIIFDCASIQELIRVIEDARLVLPGACHEVVKLSILVQKDIKDEFKKLEKEGSTLVKKIRNEKDFPRIPGVDLADKIPKKGPTKGYIDTVPPVDGSREIASDGDKNGTL